MSCIVVSYDCLLVLTVTLTMNERFSMLIYIIYKSLLTN